MDSHIQMTANKLVNNTIYVKDPRTGICFAYLTYGGVLSGITAVPEEKIPPELLITAKIDG